MHEKQNIFNEGKRNKYPWSQPACGYETLTWKKKGDF